MNYTEAALIAVLGGAAILEALAIAWSWESWNRLRRSRELWRDAYHAKRCPRCGHDC